MAWASHYDGTDLLDEVLERIEGTDFETVAGAIRDAVKPWLPGSATSRYAPHPDPIACRRALAARRPGREPGASPLLCRAQQQVYSGIRLNLVGREPLGQIRPDEADAVCAALTRSCMALVNADSGGPAVRGVLRCDDHHRREPDDCLPDLFVEWERSADRGGRLAEDRHRPHPY